MKTTTFMAAAAALVGLCAAIPDAAAEEKGGHKDDGYEYRFTDDVLNAGNPSASGAVINVIKLGRRDRLLRPRLHFVPEMLKSVESM